MDFLIIRPLDVLHLRGNRLFADAGHGEAVMPPWPSVFAGALRTRILTDRNVSFEDFKNGRVTDPAVANCVGPQPEKPGTFRIAAVTLIGPGPAALRSAATPSANGEPAAAYLPLPADLVAVKEKDAIRFHPLEPRRVAKLGVTGSFGLPAVPVLRTNTPAKPESGIWLTAPAYMTHLRGGVVAAEEWVGSAHLWKSDPRLGIALSGATRTVRSGLLYTSDTVALQRGVAFLVGVKGANGLLPHDGLVRLGGDGRGAAIERWKGQQAAAAMPWSHRPAGRGFRMILATPGFFPEGWLPPGLTDDGDDRVIEYRRLRARLVAAAVPRAEVVSGWDLANHRPKPAMRVAPVGSVYWFEVLEGDLSALSDLLAEGLWPLWPNRDATAEARRAEGFNNVWFGDWDPATLDS